MNNPWDVPPLPTKGDDVADLTYAGVGRVTSSWEGIEFELSRLYSIFVGKPNAAMQEYERRIFSDRARSIELAADAYFVSHPSQEFEGQFHCLLKMVREFADRRNEVAHSIVFQIQRLIFFRAHLEPTARFHPQYAAVPPYYAKRFHDADGIPQFAYTSVELRDLEIKLNNVTFSLSDLGSLLSDDS